MLLISNVSGKSCVLIGRLGCGAQSGCQSGESLLWNRGPPAGTVHLAHPVLSDPVIWFHGRLGFYAFVSQLKEAESGLC